MSSRTAPLGGTPTVAGSQDPHQRTMVRPRIVMVALVLACVPVLVNVGARIGNAPEHGWLGSGSAGEIGNDFAVFYTAGALILDRSPELLYDMDQFQAAYAEATGKDPAAFGTMFGNPPAFAIAMAPLSLLPWEAAWIAWTVVGLAALALALKALGLNGVLPIWGIVLLSPLGYLAVTSGQSSFAWLLVVALVFFMLDRGSVTGAGLVAGLLIVKPPLLVGLGLWWVLDRRMRPALAAAGLSASAVVLGLSLIHI